jgi:hypothetical protein
VSETRLPPFPDEIMELDRKEQAVAFLRGLGLPYWIASAHLGRWAAYVGADLERRDYVSLGRFLPPRE